MNKFSHLPAVALLLSLYFLSYEIMANTVTGAGAEDKPCHDDVISNVLIDSIGSYDGGGMALQAGFGDVISNCIIRNVRVKDCALEIYVLTPNDSGSGTYASKGNDTRSCNFYNMVFDGNQYGMLIQGRTHYLSFDNVTVCNSVHYGLATARVAAAPGNTNYGLPSCCQFTGCRFINNDSYDAIIVHNTVRNGDYTLIFTGCEASGNGSYGFSAAYKGVTLAVCYGYNKGRGYIDPSGGGFEEIP